MKIIKTVRKVARDDASDKPNGFFKNADIVQ